MNSSQDKTLKFIDFLFEQNIKSSWMIGFDLADIVDCQSSPCKQTAALAEIAFDLELALGADVAGILTHFKGNSFARIIEIGTQYQMLRHKEALSVLLSFATRFPRYIEHMLFIEGLRSYAIALASQQMGDTRGYAEERAAANFFLGPRLEEIAGDMPRFWTALLESIRLSEVMTLVDLSTIVMEQSQKKANHRQFFRDHSTWIQAIRAQIKAQQAPPSSSELTCSAEHINTLEELSITEYGCLLEWCKTHGSAHTKTLWHLFCLEGARKLTLNIIAATR